MKNINENTNVTTKGTPSLNMITPITTSTASTAQTINPFQLFNNPEFGDLRCIEKDGEPWFVGKDVAVALGYSKPTDAVRKGYSKKTEVSPKWRPLPEPSK